MELFDSYHSHLTVVLYMLVLEILKEYNCSYCILYTVLLMLYYLY